MALSYAGIPLTTVTQEAATWAELALRIQEWDVFQIRSDKSQTQTRLSIPNVENRYQPRLGVLKWPRHARKWATGLFLATKTQLDSIRAIIYTGGSYAAANLILNDESGVAHRTVTANLWMLPAHPVVQIPGYEQLYAVILVDGRWFLNKQTVNIAESALNGSTSWSSVLTLAGANVVSTVNSAYLTPGPANAAVAEYTAITLDSLAYNCGLRVCAALDGTLTAQNITAAQAAEAGNATLGFVPVCGGSLLLTGAASDSVSLKPAAVEVIFPNLDSGAVITKTSATVTGGSAEVGTQVWKSTGVTATDPVWTPTAALQAFTDQFSSDWYKWQLGDVNETFLGTCNWSPTSLDDMVEWVFNEANITTRVLRGPLDDKTEDLLHAAGVVSSVSSGLVVRDILGDRVDSVSTITFKGSKVDPTSGLGSATVSTKLSTIFNDFPSDTITSNVTITVGGGSTITLNGWWDTCSDSTFIFNGYVYINQNVYFNYPSYFYGGVYYPQGEDTFGSGSSTLNTYGTSDLRTIQDIDTLSGAVTDIKGINPSGSATGTIAGSPDGRLLYMMNTGAGTFVLENNASTSPPYGIITPDNIPYVVYSTYTSFLKYDSGVDRWRVLCFPAPHNYYKNGVFQFRDFGLNLVAGTGITLNMADSSPGYFGSTTITSSGGAGSLQVSPDGNYTGTGTVTVNSARYLQAGHNIRVYTDISSDTNPSSSDSAKLAVYPSGPFKSIQYHIGDSANTGSASDTLTGGNVGQSVLGGDNNLVWDWVTQQGTAYGLQGGGPAWAANTSSGGIGVFAYLGKYAPASPPAPAFTDQLYAFEGTYHGSSSVTMFAGLCRKNPNNTNTDSYEQAGIWQYTDPDGYLTTTTASDGFYGLRSTYDPPGSNTHIIQVVLAEISTGYALNALVGGINVAADTYYANGSPGINASVSYLKPDGVTVGSLTFEKGLLTSSS